MAPPGGGCRDAWARVFAYAWQNDDFQRRLNKDPKTAIENLVSSGQPDHLVEFCTIILRYVNDPDSEEGFLALPPPPEILRTTNEEALYNHAKQDGLYGILRVC
ncbi:MAG: hypothetical protein AB1589_30205 [Cyanobacteriota bacterium]